MVRSVEAEDNGAQFYCEAVQRMPGEGETRRRRRQAEDDDFFGDFFEDTTEASKRNVEKTEEALDVQDPGQSFQNVTEETSEQALALEKEDVNNGTSASPKASVSDSVGEVPKLIEDLKTTTTLPTVVKDDAGSQSHDEVASRQVHGQGPEPVEERFLPGRVLFRSISERSAPLTVLLLPTAAADDNRNDNSSLVFDPESNSTLRIPFVFSSRPPPDENDVMWTIRDQVIMCSQILQFTT